MNDKLEGYKFDGVVEEYQPIGSDLKATHEIEADLSNKDERESIIEYLSELDGDANLKALQKAKHPKLSIQQKVAMAMKDPAGTFIIKDGKKVSIAQSMKNSKAMNTRDNFDFQANKGSGFEDGNKNATNANPAEYNSMVHNQKKVK